VVTHDCLQRQPSRYHDPRVNVLLPEPCPCGSRALLGRESAESEGFDVWPSTMIEALDPLHGVLHAAVILVREQPHHRGAAIRIDLCGSVATRVWRAVARIVIRVTSTEPRVEPVLSRCSGTLLAANHATCLEHVVRRGGAALNVFLTPLVRLPTET